MPKPKEVLDPSSLRDRTAAGPRLLCIPDVAARLCCSTRHVYNLIGDGRLGIVDVGITSSRARVSEAELAKFIDRQSTAARKRA